MKLKLFITLVVSFISVLSSYGQNIVYETIDNFGWHSIISDSFIIQNNKDDLFKCRLSYLGHKLSSFEFYEVYIGASFTTKDLIKVNNNSSLLLTTADGSLFELKSYENVTEEYDDELNCYIIFGMFRTSCDQLVEMSLRGIIKVELISHSQNYVLEIDKDEMSSQLLERHMYVLKHLYKQYNK